MTKDQIKAVAKHEFAALRNKATDLAAAGSVQQDELAKFMALVDERAAQMEEA